MIGALAHDLAGALAQSDRHVEDSDGVAVSPAALLVRARAIARDLASVAAGEPVLAAFSNSPADLATMLGIWLAGGVVVPVSADAPAATNVQLQQVTGARFRVHGEGVDRLSTALPPEREALHAAALVLFTSGSTGHPKGVVIGHDRMVEKLGVLDRLVGLQAEDRVAVPLRLTFIFGLWVCMLALRSGAQLMLIRRGTPDAVTGALAQGASVLAAVPTMLRAMPAGISAEAPALRTVLSGGETLGAALGASLRTRLRRTGIYDLYGLTETGSCDFCLPPAEQAEGADSIGLPTEQVAYRLVGEDGNPVPDGTPGELCIRTPFGMLGYLDNSSLTEGAFRDGYFRTGDQARQRADGRVEIVGRLKDIISRGGNKIAPAEIDALLSSHPGVAAALCAGVPDDRLGEAIHAIVVAKPDAELTADALRQWAGERLERYKVPDAIHFRDALPTGSTGKVQRSRVAEIARTTKR